MKQQFLTQNTINVHCIASRAILRQLPVDRSLWLTRGLSPHLALMDDVLLSVMMDERIIFLTQKLLSFYSLYQLSNISTNKLGQTKKQNFFDFIIFYINRYHTIDINWCKNSSSFAAFNPSTAKLFNLNFHPLEVVSRWRDPQLQVSENYSDLTKWMSALFKSCRLMSHFIFNIFKMLYLMC